MMPALSVAPMMDVTDRHFRYLIRQLTRHTLLYTEMVVGQALVHGDRDRFLAYDPCEHPIALQLGGDDPKMLADCAVMAEDRGFDEVNLNVGCPSSRVQAGRFGVVLMRDPDRVARVVEAMKAQVSVPVTVKHRIGLDELDQYDHMKGFVDRVALAGADRFTVHARKAWTKGLSPKQNRNVPPLQYDLVYRLKAERPDLVIEINGGIVSPEAAQDHLDHVDAVMIGRGARDDPYGFATADQRLFGSPAPVVTREAVARAMMGYLDRALADPYVKPHHVTRHLAPLFAGQPGAKAWRRRLAEDAARGPEAIERALAARQLPEPLKRSSSSRNRKLKVVSEP
ncbi:MAG: tRNA dihydrouridine(20/20a) synthase DusA [Myxococcota bacterium]